MTGNNKLNQNVDRKIEASDMTYLEELIVQMWSFTEALTEAIDARTPYNGSHTRKVAEYASLMVDKLNEWHKAGKYEGSFDSDHKDQIVMAALLHDIGKMIVPTYVMNKSTRLENHVKDIETRLEIISLKLKLDYSKGLVDEAEYNEQMAQVEKTLDVVSKVDTAGNIDDELLELALEVCDYKYVSIDGKEEMYITPEEKACMTVCKGTLTEEERITMQSHVLMTERILSRVHFNYKFKDAPKWAVQHHEYLDGSGYPYGLKGDDLCTESRILTVADICDALLATDRPYKEPLPVNEAFEIMEEMVLCGQLDGVLVACLKECLVDGTIESPC